VFPSTTHNYKCDYYTLKFLTTKLLVLAKYQIYCYVQSISCHLELWHSAFMNEFKLQEIMFLHSINCSAFTSYQTVCKAFYHNFMLDRMQSLPMVFGKCTDFGCFRLDAILSNVYVWHALSHCPEYLCMHMEVY